MDIIKNSDVVFPAVDFLKNSSGGIMSSIMFRFLALFVNIIENLKKYFE